MKKRYLYILLFGIPGLFVAGIISILAFGGVMGILWLYVLGDNPWPAYTEQAASILFMLTVLVLWGASIVAGYLVGKRLEQDSHVNRSHVLVSAALTGFFLILMLLQQWSAGNLGPKSDAVLCSDFCGQHGYTASGMPAEDSDRTCSCYDDSGHEAQRVPLDRILDSVK